MVSIEGENMRGVTWVTIEEKRSGDWGIGGQPLTTEAVQALAAGRPSSYFRPRVGGSALRLVLLNQPPPARSGCE